MLTLFAIGTFWFWLLVIAEIIVVTALVENEAGIWATAMLILGVGGLNALSHGYIFSSIHLHPVKTIILILVYFLVGALWSIGKWYFYVHKLAAEYEDRKERFLKARDATILTPALAAELMEHLGSRYGYYDIPSAREHKADLVRWSTYWPFSMIGTLLNDVVRKIWTYIYERLQTTYQRISNHIFRDISADIEIAKQHKETETADERRNR